MNKSVAAEGACFSAALDGTSYTGSDIICSFGEALCMPPDVCPGGHLAVVGDNATWAALSGAIEAVRTTPSFTP